MIKKLIIALFLGVCAFEPVVAQTSIQARNATRQQRSTPGFTSEAIVKGRTFNRTFYGKDGSTFVLKDDGAYINNKRVSGPAKVVNFSKTVALFQVEDLSGKTVDITYNTNRSVISYGSQAFNQNK